MFRYVRWAALGLLGCAAAPALSATALQCVPYARIVSGVDIYGDALTWWDRAENQYKRGHSPRKGAVLAFRPTGPMTLGHVAVISKVLDDRHVLIRHANWSVPGAIEEDVPAVDVSDAGDWSEVRVWHSPTGRMGARTNPTFGFIYPAKPKLRPFDPDPMLGTSVRLTSVSFRLPDDLKPERAVVTAEAPVAKPARQPGGLKLNLDLRGTRFADAAPSSRTLKDIIADVKREARMR